jgi:putative transposase
MPEHIHLLITEPEVGTPSTVMQVLKQRTARASLAKKKRSDSRQHLLFGEILRTAFWQARFYDFNVWRSKKRVEKLRYMHRKPRAARIGEFAGAMALEPLSFLLPRRTRAGCG